MKAMLKEVKGSLTGSSEIEIPYAEMLSLQF